MTQYIVVEYNMILNIDVHYIVVEYHTILNTIWKEEC